MRKTSVCPVPNYLPTTTAVVPVVPTPREEFSGHSTLQRLTPPSHLPPLRRPPLFDLLVVFFASRYNSPGGVAVSAANGRIVCDNTLSSRLTVIYSELLPKIRGLLFPNA